MKRCVIEDCTLEHDLSQFFHFPKDLVLLNQWFSKLPLLNLANLNFNEAVICEHHFNPEKLIEGPGFSKELVDDAVPEIFTTFSEIDLDSCRFCLRKITGEKLVVDELLGLHYFNLMQEELSSDFMELTSCENCYLMILSCSQIKTKIQENQTLLVSFSQPEALEVKMEIEALESDEDYKNMIILDPEGSPETEELEMKDTKKRKIKLKKGEEMTELNFGEDFRKLPKAGQVVRARCQFCRKYRNDIRRHVYLNHNEEYKAMKLTEKQIRVERFKEKKIIEKIERKTEKKRENQGEKRLEEIKNLQCDHCGSFFRNKNQIKIHVKIHQKYRETFICDICNNSYKSKQLRKQHIEKYHFKIGLIYCESCGKSFSNRTFYEAHVRSKHTGEKPFKCESCGHSTYAMAELKKHIKIYHTTERFTCQVCKKVFRTKETYTEHLNRLHQKARIPCTYMGCDRYFSRNDSLNEHIKFVHLQQKDHVCQTCGLEFLRKISLKRHIVTAHMKVVFTCDVCSAEYGSTRSYRFHVRKHQDLGEEVVEKLMEKVKRFTVPLDFKLDS